MVSECENNEESEKAEENEQTHRDQKKYEKGNNPGK